MNRGILREILAEEFEIASAATGEEGLSRITLHFLPPYSPEFNPIERV